MAWVTPKTDWTARSYFNIEDYNRIKGNLEHLNGMVNQVYPDMTIAPMGADKTYSDYIYADEFNLFETNLVLMRNWIVSLGIGNAVIYSDNAPTPNYDELNRIESAMLKMYENLYGEIYGRPMMQFTLNGGLFNEYT